MKVRLQGGPFDGDRQTGVRAEDLPQIMYVVRCHKCGAHWYGAPEEHAEPYHRDEVDEKGWLVYVYRDENLARREDEREAVPAGHPDDPWVA